MKLIKESGKFEGEPVWLPKLWEYVLYDNNDYEFEHGGFSVYGFKVDSQLLDTLDSLKQDVKIGDKIEVWEDENGFVYQNIVVFDKTTNQETSIKNL